MPDDAGCDPPRPQRCLLHDSRLRETTSRRMTGRSRRSSRWYRRRSAGRLPVEWSGRAGAGVPPPEDEVEPAAPEVDDLEAEVVADRSEGRGAVAAVQHEAVVPDAWERSRTAAVRVRARPRPRQPRHDRDQELRPVGGGGVDPGQADDAAVDMAASRTPGAGVTRRRTRMGDGLRTTGPAGRSSASRIASSVGEPTSARVERGVVGGGEHDRGGEDVVLSMPSILARRCVADVPPV